MSKWLVKSKLVDISSYLSRKYIREALHFNLQVPPLNTRMLRPLFQCQSLLFSVLLLERVTFLRKYLGHLMINDEYTCRYFSVSFLSDFMKNLGKVFRLVRTNPGALLAQEEIQGKLKFKKGDVRRKKAILSSMTHIPENDKWGQGFFKIVSNQFGIDKEILQLYDTVIRSRAELACHRFLPMKVLRELTPDHVA